MPGRHSVPTAVRRQHSKPKYGRWAALALVAIVVVALGVFACTRVFDGGCSQVQQFTVAADPTIAPVITEVADDATDEDLGCTALTVESKSSAQVAASLATPGAAPALWIPDSSGWILKASKATGSSLDVARPSIAMSPTIVATKAGEAPFFATWVDVLRPGLRIGDPLTDSVASAPVMAALTEVEQGKADQNVLTSALVPIAQAQATSTEQKDVDERLSEVVRDGGTAIATEQQLVAYNAAHQDAKLAATVPLTGSFVLNYPIAVTEPAGDEHEAAKKAGVALADLLAGGDGRAVLSKNGFRGVDLTPLDGGRGLDPGAVAPLTPTDQDAATNLLRQYAVLALPSKFLAVLDVSGSMNESAGAGTRMNLMIQAMEAGLAQFRDNAQIGLWAFSTNKGGPNQDWRDLVPERPLGEQIDGKTQRQILLDQTRGLVSIVGGGTGLYDTTLAAYRKAKENYDPKYINSVVIATDGANDDQGSITLAQLLDTLQKERDPARPVIIVTIGITADADAPVLEQIAAATGGLSRTTRNPAEIPNVVVDVLKARTGR
ncbi:substrate-binding and VWA domain-containing protein [Antrihabitans sp. NCIMB 15449]|uniref:Substrate-binding and VWA domain-containing protein n=1 Tax=Antrihabitans spumae TaxID=3373370 RepID=A0ABW7JMG1_9NOCA